MTSLFVSSQYARDASRGIARRERVTYHTPPSPLIDATTAAADRARAQGGLLDGRWRLVDANQIGVALRVRMPADVDDALDVLAGAGSLRDARRGGEGLGRSPARLPGPPGRVSPASARLWGDAALRPQKAPQ
jgi:hypothetical protein